MRLLQLSTARFNVVMKTKVKDWARKKLAIIGFVLHFIVFKQCLTPICFNNSLRVALWRNFESTNFFASLEETLHKQNKLKVKLTMTLNPGSH